MYHWPKSLTEGDNLEYQGCRYEKNIKIDVKEIATSCRMDPFDLEHGSGAGCCEAGIEHRNL